MIVDPSQTLLEEIGVLENDAPLLREHCKEFKNFVREFWDTVPGTEPLLWNWHIDYECEELQRIAHRVSARMPKKHDAVFNVPFGTSKSSIISILWQAWIWTFMPDCRVISATHTQSLVRDLAGKFYAVVTSEKYKACWPIKFTSESTDELKNDKGGERMSCTVGGKTPTGRHAHIVIIDDPIDPQGARSEAELENARKFMSEVIPSRVVDKDVSVIILVMQRLHFRDPTAVMVDLAEGEDASPLLVVRLPGELLSGERPSPDLDVLRRRAIIGNWKNHDGSQAIPYENGLLDPRRLSQMVLNRYRRRMGAYSYAGQVLQKPTPPGGGMFKVQYFSKRVKAAPYHGKRIRGWDRACLVAGTEITTKRGQIPIENVTVEDWVLTRRGWKRVTKSWMTERVDQSELCGIQFVGNGAVIIGTRNHLVWTDNRGWAELATLTMGDKANTLKGVTPPHPVNFLVVDDVKQIPVYDLTVEDAHEFFANGVLVHNSTEDGGCYTAGVLMCLSPEGDYFVEHCVHGQWEPVERNRMIFATALRDRARYGPNHEPLIVIEAEGGSTGGESFRRLASQLSGFRVREDRPSGSKDSRAEPWSAQCAAGNVYLVDNGESKGLGKADWDVEGFVTEHTLFRPEPGKRLGKWKDQVDSASMSFNLLAGFQGKRGATVVSYGIGSAKQKGLRVVVVSRENLINTTTDHKCLLVSIQDPIPKIAEEEVMCNGEAPRENQAEGTIHSENGQGKNQRIRNGFVEFNGYVDQPVETGQTPAHGLNRILDILILSFCDIAPVEYQDKWDEVVPPWNETPEKLIMAQDHGRKLWSFLRKQRDPSHDVIVFQDEGDRRALSVAYAFVDVMRLPRSVIHVVGQVEELNHKGDAPNTHVFNQTKLCRGLVV